MQRLEQYINSIANILLVVPLVLLAGLMFLTAADVIGRFFGHAITGAYQISEIMQVGVICLAWPFTTAILGHVRVEFFVLKLPAWIKNKINILNHLIAVLIFALIAWQGIELVKRSWELGELVGIIEIPLFPFQVVISVGASINCLVLLVQLGNFFAKSRKEEC